MAQSVRSVPTRISSLEHALMGQIDLAPQSGYDLRTAFAKTPLAHFSDSPGAIYPALLRLRRRGWIVSTGEKAANARGRTVFRLSARGRLAFLRWLRTPPSRDELLHDASGPVLRFAFMSQALGAGEGVAFLRGYRAVLSAYVDELRRFHTEFGRAMPLSGRLAFESGIAGHRHLLSWTRRAERALAKSAAPRSSAASRSRRS
jgi:PadR family transcriptional regulator, regulatory protein AphA